MNIEILNFERYNPRKDMIRPQWFRLDNRMVFDPQFHDFKSHEMWLWIVLLSLASMKNDAQIICTTAYLIHASKLSMSQIKAGLIKLQQNQCVRVTLKPRSANLNDPAPTEITGITEKTEITELIKSKSPYGTFDFDRLYDLYPRKLGKKKGVDRAKTQIKTQGQYEALRAAIKNYARYCVRKELQYIQHFSTFMNVWTDWVNPDPSLFKPQQDPKLSVIFNTKLED